MFNLRKTVNRGIISFLVCTLVFMVAIPGQSDTIVEARITNVALETSTSVNLTKLGAGSVDEKWSFKSEDSTFSLKNVNEGAIKGNLKRMLLEAGYNFSNLKVSLNLNSPSNVSGEDRYYVTNLAVCRNGVWMLKSLDNNFKQRLIGITGSTIFVPVSMEIKSNISYRLPKGSYLLRSLNGKHFHKVYGNSVFDISREETYSSSGLQVNIRCDYHLAKGDIIDSSWMNNFANLLKISYMCPDPPSRNNSSKKVKSGSTNFSTEDESNQSIQNDDLKVVFSDDGNFQLYRADGTPLLYPGFTSNFTLQIDGTNYDLKDDSNHLGDYISSPLTIVDSSHAYIVYSFFNEKLKVKHEFFLGGKALQFKIECINDDNQHHSVKVRYLLDTQLGDNDGAPLDYEGRVYTYETEVENPELVQKWQAFDSIETPTITAIGTVGNPSWYRLIFAHWPEATNSVFDYTVDPNRPFYTPGYNTSPESDSCVLEYFDLGNISPGSGPVELSMYYGTGEPSNNAAAIKDQIDLLTTNLINDIDVNDDSAVKSWLKSVYVTYKNLNVGNTVVTDDLENSISQFLESLEEELTQPSSSFNPVTILTSGISIGAQVGDVIYQSTLYKKFEEDLNNLYTSILSPQTLNGVSSPEDFANRVLNDSHSKDLIRETFHIVQTLKALKNINGTFQKDQNLESSFNNLTQAQQKELYNRISAINDEFGYEYSNADDPQRYIVLPNGKISMGVKTEDLLFEKINALNDKIQTAGNIDTLVFAAAEVGSLALIIFTTGAAIGPALTIISAVSTATSVGTTGYSDDLRTEIISLHESILSFLRDEMGSKDESSSNYGTGYDGGRVLTLRYTTNWLESEVSNYNLDQVNGSVSNFQISTHINADSLGTVSFTVTNTGSIPAFVSAHTFINKQPECSIKGFMNIVYPSDFDEAKLEPGQSKTISCKFLLPPNFSKNGAKPYYSYTEIFLDNKPIYMSSPVAIYVGSQSQITQSMVDTSSVIDTVLSQGNYVSQQVHTADSSDKVTFGCFYHGSKVNLHLYDSQGHHVGVNYQTGNIDMEIPGAKYSGPDANPEWISVPNNGSTEYTVKVVGVDLRDPEHVAVVKEEIPHHSPIIYADPESLNIESTPDFSFNTLLNVKEVGGDQDINDVSISVSGEASSWVSLNNTHFDNIPAGSTLPLLVTVNVPSNAASRNYTATISISTANAGNIDIPLTLTVGETLGDVNGDGSIDSGDAILILRYSAGLITLTPSQLACADVNKDGAVDSGDAILVLRYAAGLIDHF